MRRLSLSLLLVVLVAVIGLGWVLDRLFVVLGEGDQDALGPYRSLGINLVQNFETRETLEAAASNWELDTDADMYILDRDELALPDQLNQLLSTGKPLAIESDAGVVLYFSQTDWSHALAITPPPSLTSELPLRFILTLLFYIGIVLLMMLWLYPLLRRLQSLRSAAKKFGEGNLSTRVSTHQYSYLNDIESEFNRMGSRIQGLVSDNKLLSNAVSHDLRTPLARLRFGIDALGEEVDPARQSDYLTRISGDLSEMEKLVAVLLDYARLDQGLSRPALQKVDLGALVDGRVEVFSEHASRQLEWQAPAKPVLINAHPRYLEMIVNNLIQNALAYSQQRVTVKIVRDRNRTWLCVDDDGPGIPVSERDEIVKPFVRGSVDTTTGNPKGFGMGLAIVQRIAEWMDATLLIESSDELGGARLTVGFLGHK